MIALLMNPWVLLVVGVTYLGTFVGGYYKGSSAMANASHVIELRQTVELQKATMAQQRAVIEEAQRQASETSNINESATTRAEATETYAKKLQEQVNALKHAKGPHCRLTGPDAAGLRAIGLRHTR